MLAESGEEAPVQLKEVTAASPPQVSPVGTSPGHPCAVPAVPNEVAFSAEHQHPNALAMATCCSRHQFRSPKNTMFFAKAFLEAQHCAPAEGSTAHRGSIAPPPLSTAILTPLHLGRGSRDPPAPPESVPRATDMRGHCPRPPGPRGSPQLHLRAGDALQQLLHPRGVGVHTHLPRGP